MRKTCLNTPPATAFFSTQYADNTVVDGWDGIGSAGPKTASISAGAARVAVDQGGRKTNGPASNKRGDSTNMSGSTSKGGSTNGKGR